MIQRFQIYGAIGAVLFIVATLWPHVYSRSVYEENLSEGVVTNVFGVSGFVKKWEKFGSRIPKLIIPAGAHVIVPDGAPLWRIILDAPQYPRTSFPDGLLVNVFVSGPKNGCENVDCLHELDVINHYIGMLPLTFASPVLKNLSAYLANFVVLLLIPFILYKKKLLGWFVVPPILAPLGLIIMISFWGHWVGFHLNSWAAFRVHSFTPILFGIGKVAQFSTHNRPAYGLTLLLLASLFLIMAYLSKRKFLGHDKK
jgi:hypothetical protein